MGAIILVILAIVLTAFIATYALRRITSGAADRDETVAKLSAATDALDQFAGAQKRLPCPADPTVDTGVEVLPAVGAATCSFPAGTLPWQTLGLRRESGYDAWGLKLSYRVYTGDKGSLTQPRGVDMSECDITEPTTGLTTPVVGSAGGLCVSSASPLGRSTKASQFLHGSTIHDPTGEPPSKRGKELVLVDLGVTRANVAYVVMSHGSTGLGAYTASGARRDLPTAADERNNLNADGPFTIKAFSDVNVAATAASHFDDIVVYRTLPDLAKTTALGPREWEDEMVGTSQFNSATAAAALGQTSVSPGDLGTSSLDLGSVKVTGFSSGGTANNISLDSITLPDLTVVEGFGIAGNPGNLMSSAPGEYLKAQFPSAAAKFAVTLAHFGRYAGSDGTYSERVEFRFFNGTTIAGSVTKSGCSADGGLANFSFTAPGSFDSVEIRPISSESDAGTFGITELLVSEVTACVATASSCTTSLAPQGTTCP